MAGSFVDFVVSRLVKTPAQDVQMEGALIAKADATPRGRPDYLWLKDLTNPQQAYWDHIGELPQPSVDLKKIFAYGNRLHQKAGVAFTFVDGFAGAEVILDGAASGVPGVRGKVDFRYGTSLVEFKTTSKVINTADDVWTQLPQDIEQLLFYAALWTLDSPTHYLVYYTMDQQPLRAFKVTIKDRAAIKKVANERREALQAAIKAKDPSKLNKCRYYGGTCAIGQAKKCACETTLELDTKPLRVSCELERDADMEGTLITAFEEADSIPLPITPWDLETPRRAYLKQRNEDEESDYERHEFWTWRALREAGLMPGILEVAPAPRIMTPLHFKATGFFVKRQTGHSGETHTRFVPSLLRVKQDKVPPNLFGLKNYLMQLGVLCALSGKETGLLIVELPNAPARIAVYQATFKDLAGIRAEVKARLGVIKNALDTNDITALPLCPDWLRGHCTDCKCKDGIVNIPVKDTPKKTAG